MKRSGILVMMLGMFACIFAQSTIRGVVTDESKQPLEGVNVSIKNTTYGAVSQSDGSFELKKVKGAVDLQFSLIGYETIVRTVDVTKQKSLSITMNVAPIMYDDFEVTATRAGENAPFAVEDINANELEARNSGGSLPDVLKLSPSLVVSTENGLPFGNIKFRIRGSDPTRINVTVDGVPLNDAESQAVYWVNMTDVTESVSDIQIQRGVGSSTNGAATFGASVNIQTKGYDANPYAEISSYVGSFDSYKNSVQFNTGLIKDHFVFNARLSDLKTDGYVQHTGMNNQSYFVSGGYFSDKTSLRLKVFGNEEHTGISWWGVTSYDMEKNGRDYNIAGDYYDKNGDRHYYEDQKDNYWQNHFHLNFSQELSDELQMKAALHYTHGKGYYEQFQDDDNWMHDTDFEYYGFPNASFVDVASNDTLTGSDLVRQRWMRNDFYGGVVSLEYNMDDLYVVFGASANRYDGDHFGEVIWVENNPGIAKKQRYYFNNGTKDDIAAFVKASYNITSQLSAYGDIQYRYVGYEMKGDNNDYDKPDFDIDEDYNFLNPKAGVMYREGHHKAFASFAISNREPTRTNLKDAVGDEANQPTAETMYDTELGYQFSTMHFTVGANVFYMNYKDQLVPTGEKNSVGYEILTNVEESYRAGVELSMAWRPTSWAMWEANATFSKNKIHNFTEYNTYYDEWYWQKIDYKGTYRGTTDIAYSPNIVASSMLTFYPIKNGTISLNSKYVGEQYFDNTSQDGAKLDAYFVNDLMIGYKMPLPFADYVELKVMINNIFDADYISDAYGGKDMVANEGSTTEFHEKRWTYYFPQAFRNYGAKLVVRF